jgi:DNA-binding CsgD family transcriptional regulator
VSSTSSRIATLLGKGLSVAEVARRTGLAYATVSYHRERLRDGEQPRDDASPDEAPAEDFLFPIRTRDEIHRLLSAGNSRAEVARVLGVSKSTVTYHAGRFGLVIDARAARRYDWTVIQRYYDAGHPMEACRARFGFSKAAWSDAVKRGAVVARPRAMPLEALLSISRNRSNLKRRLLKAGLLQAICGRCGLTEWQGIPLALQLHHVNGVRSDNLLANLTLLCPNCHSQTDTWGGRNGWRGRAGAQPAG